MARHRWLTPTDETVESSDVVLPSDRRGVLGRGALAPADGTGAVGASVPLLFPRTRAAHPWRHYLLEGQGWASLRVASDLLAALAAVLVVALLPRPVGASGSLHVSLLAFPLVVSAAMHLRGLYARRMREVILDMLGALVGAVSVAAMALLAVEVLVTAQTDIGPELGRIWLWAVLLIGAGRAGIAQLQRHARANLLVGKSTLVVGAGMVGAQVARRLEEHPEYGLRPVGYLDANPPDGGLVIDRNAPVLGSPQDLRRIVDETGAEHVILAFSSAPDRGLIPLVRQCDELGVEVSLVPRLFESINDRVALDRLGGLPLLGLRAVDPKGWQFRAKYAIDRPLALLMLLVMSPVMAAAAIAVKLSSPGPVFFRQTRVGRDGKVFELLKFRSMRTEEDGGSFVPRSGHAPGGIEGRDRRTAVGGFLRRTAIDELPQLLNVLRGEMSLVGPRPERPEFVELFEIDHDRYSDRHRVKSGITGWAQVHGLRGQTSLSDRVEWDNFYIENWSLWLDFKVLLMTVGAVLHSGENA